MNEFGFNSDSLRRAENVNFATMHKMIMDTGERIMINKKRGLNTLVVVHYGGHGVVHNAAVQAVLPDP